MIIGLTGKNGSGKGEAAKYFEKKNFSYYSLSNVLREEVTNRGLEVTRENLVALGNEMRSAQGAGVLAEKVLSLLDPGKNCVIDSIRHPEEVKALRTLENFILVEVQAPPEVRFERMKIRGREKDPADMEEFLALEKIEASSQNESDQQLDRALTHADLILENNGNLEKLHMEIDNLIAAKR